MTTVDRIFQLMEQRNLTAKELANALKISQGNITDWKKGRSKPSVPALEKIANYFDVSMDFLLGTQTQTSNKLNSLEEIKKYYDESVFGDIQVNHILITADTNENMSSEEKTNAENKAKEQVNSIIEELKKSDNPKERFTELAKEYSKDESTKNNGGSLGFINIGTLSSAYDEIVKNANSLKDNSFSTSIITTELGYHVIFRESQKEKASLDDVTDSIRTTLGEKKLNADNTMSVTALTELRKKYGMDIVDSEIQKQYGNYITNTIASIENQSNSNS